MTSATARELCPEPRPMQFPMGPACIFLRKGIAEKQRVRRGRRAGRAQGAGAWVLWDRATVGENVS